MMLPISDFFKDSLINAGLLNLAFATLGCGLFAAIRFAGKLRTVPPRVTTVIASTYVASFAVWLVLGAYVFGHGIETPFWLFLIYDFGFVLALWTLIWCEIYSPRISSARPCVLAWPLAAIVLTQVIYPLLIFAYCAISNNPEGAWQWRFDSHVILYHIEVQRGSDSQYDGQIELYPPFLLLPKS